MTGIDSFTDPGNLGALYPFQGFEILLVAVGVVLWLAWHVVQVRKENREYKDALRLYRRVGMEQALHLGGGGHLATQEDIEEAEEAPPVDDTAAGAGKPSPD